MSDADGDDTASWDPLLHTGDSDDPPVASGQAGSCLDVSACVGEGTSRRFVEGGVNPEVDEGVIPDAADEVSRESTASATECRVSNAKGDAGADAPSNLPAEQAVPPASVLPVSRLTGQLSQASFDNMSRSDDGGNGGFHETPNILAGAADAAREGFRKFASNIRAENGNSSEKMEVAGDVGDGKLLRDMHKKKISFAAVAKSHELAKAAKMELHFGTSPDGRGPSFPEHEDGQSSLLAHELDVQRQYSVMHAVKEDAATESRLVREMLSLVVDRLKTGMAFELVVDRLKTAMASCAAYAVMFGEMASAEAYYSKRLESVGADARKPVMAAVGPHSLQDAQQDVILQLPLLVARAHSQMRELLKQDADAFKALEQKFTSALRTITTDASLLADAVQVAMRGLHSAFEAHKSACKSADCLVQENQGSGKPVQLEHDPWVTESSLANAHTHLRTCLQEERCCMDEAFDQLKHLELERTALMSRVSQGCFSYYETSASTVLAHATDLAAAARGIVVEPELEKLMNAVEQAVETSKELAARQADNLESVATELFCSPEILRQGAMELWDGGSVEWVEYHFVLTRSGFLHWFPSTDEMSPIDGMNLGRCSMEAGEAPIFNVHEDGHGPWYAHKKPRKITFKAQDIDDCCEW
eukprot:CAMPEP_0177756620 /NCGR_PEP_ID=MMETSP0491_2-20121128/3206_1 /TAXON_ID=63592 /ORGANISM="Tetraselmis chuii, Strain PLY429" /LENGTH=645 /DNA_ID=CAMNT_0019272215 /DNA_START=222 /DNA_END=2157 /DNA_ORIENTATION=-